jgi:hypothetical protein
MSEEQSAVIEEVKDPCETAFSKRYEYLRRKWSALPKTELLEIGNTTCMSIREREILGEVLKNGN